MWGSCLAALGLFPLGKGACFIVRDKNGQALAYFYFAHQGRGAKDGGELRQTAGFDQRHLGAAAASCPGGRILKVKIVTFSPGLYGPGAL